MRTKRRIIWRDYAAAFQAALECVNAKQSRDFAIQFIPYAVPFFTGEGDPPSASSGREQPQAGSSWDDWCGNCRRKENHPAGDQTEFFQTALRCAVKLVLHSLDWMSADMAVSAEQKYALLTALDLVLDERSPIYSFRREPNGAAHDLAMALHAECTELWRQGGGPEKRMRADAVLRAYALVEQAKAQEGLGAPAVRDAILGEGGEADADMAHQEALPPDARPPLAPL